MAVNTGKCLVFISEEWRIELTEHADANFSGSEETPPFVRVRFFKKALNGEYIPGHYEDFHHSSVNLLAEQIEKYVQEAVGQNIREN